MSGWLDMLIANKRRSEKVDTMLAVICTTLHIADNAIQSRYNSFRAALERWEEALVKLWKIHTMWLIKSDSLGVVGLENKGI